MQSIAPLAADSTVGRSEFWVDGASTWLPPQSSTTAHEIDALFYFILYSSTILTLIVLAAMIYFIVKYRRKSHADRPQEVHESKWLEISWIVVPTLLVMIVFFWGFRAYVSTTVPPANAYEIDVVGKKWNWTFQYANGVEIAGQEGLVVPVNTPIKLRMTSVDVLHSFFVPEFRIKHDVLPGRYSYVWFEAPEEGIYQVVCTEYCGTSHSDMGARIRVVSQGEFNEFLPDGYSTGPMMPVAMGERMHAAQGCNACHSIDGSPGVGPTWQNIWGEPRPGSEQGVVNEEYVYESIANPNVYKTPGYESGNMAPYELDEDQLAGIAAYIRQLSGAMLPSDTLLAVPDIVTDTTASAPDAAAPVE
ncbi:MAG: cytochrome c oxidase subunit II [Bacteroidota bacterium]